MKRTIRVVIGLWIVIWLIFLLRPYVLADRGYKLPQLIFARDKKAFLYGEEFLALLDLCRQSTPENATYQEYGVAKQSLDMRRLEYDLYPRTRSEDPDFLIVYKKEKFSKEGYAVYKKLNDQTLLLKRL